MNYSTETVRLNQLLLDPNNYRFFDMEEYSEAANNRIHESTVQDRAEELIRLDGKEELRALKESIETNGYVPIETIVIKPYSFRDDFFVVVEGNRRVAAMRWLKKDREGGSALREGLIESFDTLTAIVLSDGEDGEEETKRLQHIVMGLRHVSGIKQWGGYQRAKLVVELVDGFGLPTNDAAKQIGMSSHEASRRYRALKALEQMEEDEEFGEASDPQMYRLFHEAISVVKIKEWLGWDENEYRFTNSEHLEKFYKLLVPHKPEDEEELPRTRDPKIQTYLNVRDLRDIIGNVEAEECLFDPERSFSDALAVAKASATTNWAPRIAAAIQTLQKMPMNTLSELSAEEIAPLKELRALLTNTLTGWGRLTNNPVE